MRFFSQKITLILFLLFILAAAIRVWLVSGDHVVFYWDQARDALVSRAILEQGDLKILGPSASGTGDQVYHGVMFYYLIGPLYTLFGGNPTYVTMVLGVINALGVFVVYALGKEVTRSKRVGLIAATLFAVSANAVFYGTWLSNPTLAPLTVALFYLFLYRGVFEKRYWSLVWAALFLGMSQQSAIFLIYLWAPVVGGLLWMYHTGTIGKVPAKVWLASGGVYGLSVATMVLGELMLWQRGILNGGAIAKMAVSTQPFDEMLSIMGGYVRAFAAAGLPQYAVLSGGVALIALCVFFFSQKRQERWWVVLFLSAPLLLLLVMSRRDGHNFVGMSMLVYVAVAYGLARLSRWQLYAWLLPMVMVGYALMNLQSLQEQRAWGDHPLVVQKGAMLDDQLAALDYMYTQAGGQPFSVSSLTNPLGMNTTWSYLFEWYGNQKYGYAPVFYGPAQAGLFGGDLLKESATPLALHFSILEPVDGIDEGFVKVFEEEQELRVGKQSQERQFGELRVQERKTP